MGDIVHAMAALQFVREALPDCRIDWIVEEVFAGIPEHNPDIDRILPVRLKALRQNKMQLFEEIGRIREYAGSGYDLVIDAQGLIKSAVISRMLGAKTAGFDKDSVREKAASFLYQESFPIPYEKNVIYRNIELVMSSLGLEWEEAQLEQKKAFLYYEIPVKDRENFVKFGQNIKNLKSDLYGISFDLEIDSKLYHFEAPILGDFNAINITAAIMVAIEMGFDIKELQKIVKNLKPIEHRLQKIESGGKIIIDDSFNGNFEGMVSSYELVKNYPKRKVIITPGIVESNKDANIKLAKKIDEIFDLVIITGKINRKILDENIKRAKKIILDDKSKLQEILAKNTSPSDLILFSNDTPAYM